MVAYQAETDLLALLRPHYARIDQEGRTFCMSCSASAGDIRVSDSELHITLAPLSSPHRTPPTPSVRCSIKRRRSSPALACDSVGGAPATTYRAGLPRLPGRAQHPHA